MARDEAVELIAAALEDAGLESQHATWPGWACLRAWSRSGSDGRAQPLRREVVLLTDGEVFRLLLDERWEHGESAYDEEDVRDVVDRYVELARRYLSGEGEVREYRGKLGRRRTVLEFWTVEGREEFIPRRAPKRGR